MATLRDRPYGNANFLVDLGDGGDVHAPQAGFAEVVFPSFALHAARGVEQRGAAGPGDEGAGTRLILRRGVTGSLKLYAWWHKARRGKPPQRRTVKVHLLAEDQSAVVLTWRFRNARPVTLTYSPLRAADGGVLMETLEIEFDSVEVA